MSEYIFSQLSDSGFDMKNVKSSRISFKGKSARLRLMAKRRFYAGRLIEHKGVHIAIQAIAPLLREDPHLTFEIIGSGMKGYESHLRDLCLKLGVSDQVKWLG